MTEDLASAREEGDGRVGWPEGNTGHQGTVKLKGQRALGTPPQARDLARLVCVAKAAAPPLVIYKAARSAISFPQFRVAMTEEDSPRSSARHVTSQEQAQRLPRQRGCCPPTGTEAPSGLLRSLLEAKEAGGSWRRCHEHRGLVLVGYLDLKMCKRRHASKYFPLCS